MNRTFDFEWKQLHAPLLCILLLGGLILYLQGSFSMPDVTGLIIAGLILTIWKAWPLCRVTLTPSETVIKYLLPLRKGGRFRHEEVVNYTEIVVQMRTMKILVGGFFHPANQPRIMLPKSGTRDFEALNDALLELYPAAAQTEP